MTEVQLIPLETSDREQFIRDNQEAFNYGALEEFGQRDDHFEETARSSPMRLFPVRSTRVQLSGSCRTINLSAVL